MDDQAKLERMLRILLMLASGRKYEKRELADKLELSARTVNRYFATIRNVGIIVHREDGLYHIPKLEKPFKEISDLLHFSEEEAYVLSKAIHSIDDNNILKENLSKKLYSLYNFKKVAETIVKPGNSDCVTKIIDAIQDKRQVLLQQYRSSHGKLVRDRLVEPFGFTTNYISIWAYEPESQRCKLFKTARIEKVAVLNKHYQNESLHKQMPVDVFRISAETQIRVILRLTLRAFNLLIEEYPLSEQYITEVDDSSWQFDASVCGFEGVGRFCLGLCDEVEIQQPQGLKEYLKQKIKKSRG